MPNIYDPSFDQPREQPGFLAQRAFLGRQAGSERLGLSLWSVLPGQAAYPYHCHLADEELIVLLEGNLDLRTPEGWRELRRGEVIAFPRGEGGAHQLVNRAEAEARFLSFSTSGEPDIVLYIDSGKVGAFERRPGGGGLWKIFRAEETADYYEGETPPA